MVEIASRSPSTISARIHALDADSDAMTDLRRHSRNSRWCIDDARTSKLYSPSAFTFNAEWSPISDDDTVTSLWRKFPVPFTSSSEPSHLDFDSDEVEEECEIEHNADEDDELDEMLSESEASDRVCDEDEISFVLRESARALIRGFVGEVRDSPAALLSQRTAQNVLRPSNLDEGVSILQTLDEQLINDPRGSWTAICWRDAAPDSVDPISDPQRPPTRPVVSSPWRPLPKPPLSPGRPQTTQLVIPAFTTHAVRSRTGLSPLTPGDPILSGTPPLSPTPRSPTPRSPPTHELDDSNTLRANLIGVDIAAPVPRYRPASDPAPPYTLSVSVSASSAITTSVSPITPCLYFWRLMTDNLVQFHHI